MEINCRFGDYFSWIDLGERRKLLAAKKSKVSRVCIYTLYMPPDGHTLSKIVQQIGATMHSRATQIVVQVPPIIVQIVILSN